MKLLRKLNEKVNLTTVSIITALAITASIYAYDKYRPIPARETQTMEQTQSEVIYLKDGDTKEPSRFTSETAILDYANAQLEKLRNARVGTTTNAPITNFIIDVAKKHLDFDSQIRKIISNDSSERYRKQFKRANQTIAYYPGHSGYVISEVLKVLEKAELLSSLGEENVKIAKDISDKYKVDIIDCTRAVKLYGEDTTRKAAEIGLIPNVIDFQTIKNREAIELLRTYNETTVKKAMKYSRSTHPAYPFNDSKKYPILYDLEELKFFCEFLIYPNAQQIIDQAKSLGFKKDESFYYATRAIKEFSIDKFKLALISIAEKDPEGKSKSAYEQLDRMSNPSKYYQPDWLRERFRK
ncbi:MAG: hypothetical protein AABX38_03745 [Candidatus Micrarchaeota archaeon]